MTSLTFLIDSVCKVPGCAIARVIAAVDKPESSPIALGALSCSVGAFLASGVALQAAGLVVPGGTFATAGDGQGLAGGTGGAVVAVVAV